MDTYRTREGFDLPRPLIFPEVAALSDLLTVEGPWDFATMNHRNGYPQAATPPEVTRPGWDKTVGRFCSWSGDLPGRGHMHVTPTEDLLAVIYADPEPITFAFYDRINFRAIYHPRTDRVLLTADASSIIASRWLAYVSPESVPQVRPTLADLPMGGCSTSAAHYEHLAAGDQTCENERTPR